MIERFAEEMQQRLGKSVRDLEHQLGHNQCGSWEQYHHKVGYIAGLESAAGIVANLLTIFHEDDDKEA